MAFQLLSLKPNDDGQSEGLPHRFREVMGLVESFECSRIGHRPSILGMYPALVRSVAACSGELLGIRHLSTEDGKSDEGLEKHI